MIKYFLLISLFVSLSIGENLPPCGEGQLPSKCGCDIACTNPEHDDECGCTVYERCFCKPGYVRLTTDPGSICVPQGICEVCSNCNNTKECGKTYFVHI